MKVREVLERLKELELLAYLNRANTFNRNDERTKQDIEDYLDTDVRCILELEDAP